MKKLKKTAMISIMVFFVIATGFLFQKSFFNKDSSLPEKKKTQETEEKMNSKTKVQKVQNTLEDEVDQPLRLYVDGEETALEEDVLFLSDREEIYVCLDEVEELFSCAVFRYPKKKILIQKENHKMMFTENSREYHKDHVKGRMSNPLCSIGEKQYMPMKDVSGMLGFHFSWKADEKKVSLESTETSEKMLPAKFDLRTMLRAPQIRNQGRLGTCWAIASLSSVESVLGIQKEQMLSADHMTLHNSFSKSQSDGGDYTMAMAYLTAWQGPVYEKEDAYGDGSSPDGLSARYHVQEILLLEDEDTEEKIKKAVFQYGGVQSSIFSSVNSSVSTTPYFNRQTSAYYYDGKESANHDVVIIGWDDSYSRENFNLVPKQDGAFICQNSWGEEFGEDGIFYISYEDSNIKNHGIVYSGIEDTGNYDEIYQSDLCGWVGQIGYNQSIAFGTNVYKAEEDIVIKACGIYATDQNMRYQIFVQNQYTGVSSLQGGILTAEGKKEEKGYYTIPFQEGISVNAGDFFAVIVKYYTPDSKHPIAVEYAADEFTQTVSLSDGKGFISANGKDWESVEEKQNCNLCIKAYADKK